MCEDLASQRGWWVFGTETELNYLEERVRGLSGGRRGRELGGCWSGDVTVFSNSHFEVVHYPTLSEIQLKQ